MSAPTPQTPTVIRATVGEDWPRRWPCSGFRPGDVIEARYAPNGDLVGLEAWRDGAGIFPLDVEAAELGAALAAYGSEARCCQGCSGTVEPGGERYCRDCIHDGIQSDADTLRAFDAFHRAFTPAVSA